MVGSVIDTDADADGDTMTVDALRVVVPSAATGTGTGEDDAAMMMGAGREDARKYRGSSEDSTCPEDDADEREAHQHQLDQGEEVEMAKEEVSQSHEGDGASIDENMAKVHANDDAVVKEMTEAGDDDVDVDADADNKPAADAATTELKPGAVAAADKKLPSKHGDDDDDDKHRDETHEHVSDISASSAEESDDMGNDWPNIEGGGGDHYAGGRASDPSGRHPRNRSFTICSVITNNSDHESSIRSQRENVDRLLMTGGGASIGRGGGGSSLGGASDHSPSHHGHGHHPHAQHQHAMAMNSMRHGGHHGHGHHPSNFAYTYDQNYYKSGDWLRFVPRRSSAELAARSSISSSDPPSLGGVSHDLTVNSAPAYGSSPGYRNVQNNNGSNGNGQQQRNNNGNNTNNNGGINNINPDQYYRGFDNTRIRTGFGSTSRIRQSEHSHRMAQQHFMPSNVGPNGEILGTTPSSTGDNNGNISLDQGMSSYVSHPHHMYPNMISVPIDEEEGGGEEREFNESGDLSHNLSGSGHPSPPMEICCNPNEDANNEVPHHDHNHFDEMHYSQQQQAQPPALHELEAGIREQIAASTSALPSPGGIPNQITHNTQEGVINGDPTLHDPRAMAMSSHQPPTPSPPPLSVEPGVHFESSLRVGGIIPPSKPASTVTQNHPVPPHEQERRMHEASWDSKFETYACRVDQRQEDRSVEIPIFSMVRPHMRAFHYAWLTFFFAFLAWFAITPLLAEVQKSLNLTKEQIWTSNIASVSGAVVTRCVAGLFCDIYGARWMSAAVLFICGVPTIFTGAVNTIEGLSVLRLVTGIGGSAFVTCQYWTCTMFTKEVAGTANALAAGWGNLGGGVAQIFVGSMLFPFFKWVYGAAGAEGDPADLSWRTCCVIPGLICTVFTFFVLRYADDSPKGNYTKRKHLGLMQKQSAMRHIKAAIHDHNTWLLLIQYGCCFGVELTTSNAAALYFKEEFELSTEAAAAVASTFGWMNLFARGLGGFLSDISNAYSGMRGRLIWQLICFFFEGVFVMVFSQAKTLPGAITALMTFSVFVQGAEGSTFGIVPYLNPNVTGTVAGIVGAGGNAGAVIFSILFRQMEYRDAFLWMGAVTSGISFLSSFVWIKGYEGLFFRKRVIPVNPPHQEKDSNISKQQQQSPNTSEPHQATGEEDGVMQANHSRSYIDTDLDLHSSISGPLSH